MVQFDGEEDVARCVFRWHKWRLRYMISLGWRYSLHIPFIFHHSEVVVQQV